MVDKDFRPNPDVASLAEQELAAAALAGQSPYETARQARPVEFLDKKENPSANKQIRYTEDGRPISPRYDALEAELEEQSAPKASSAQVPATSFPSSEIQTQENFEEVIPGLEDVSTLKTDSPASVEKDSGLPKERSTGTQTSSPAGSTSPGRPELPAVPRQRPPA